MADPEGAVTALRESFLLAGGTEDGWDELVSSPKVPKWATQWMDAGEEGHREKVADIVKSYLQPEMMVEYEANWDDGGGAGRALVLVTEVFYKKNTFGLSCQHIVATDREYQEWSQDEINKKGTRKLHLCISKGPCRVVAPSTGVHWIHLRAFRVIPFAVAFNQEYCLEAAVRELGRQVNERINKFKADGVPSGVPVPKSAAKDSKAGVHRFNPVEEDPFLGSPEREEEEPHSSSRRKSRLPEKVGEKPPKIPKVSKEDAKSRAAAKVEANRAALALRTASPVMVRTEVPKGTRTGGDREKRSKEPPRKGTASWLDTIPSDPGGGRGGGGGPPPGDDGDGSGSSSGDGDRKGRGGGRKRSSSSGSSGDGGDDGDDSRDEERLRASLVVPPKKDKRKEKRRRDERNAERRNKRGRSKEKKKRRADKDKVKKEKRDSDRKRQRERKRRRGSRSSSSHSSSETGSLEKIYGKETKKFDTLAEKARKHPGRLLQGGLEEMRKYMAARVGEGQAEQSWRQQRVGAYVQQVLFVRHNPSQIGVRNTREILTLSAALDALLEQDFPMVGDLLMQRLKAVESALVEGWNVAAHQELIASPNASLTSAKEKSYAARQALQAQRLEESVKKRRSG